MTIIAFFYVTQHNAVLDNTTVPTKEASIEPQGVHDISKYDLW